jgi:hypothetical protein
MNQKSRSKPWSLSGYKFYLMKFDRSFKHLERESTVYPLNFTIFDPSQKSVFTAISYLFVSGHVLKEYLKKDFS